MGHTDKKNNSRNTNLRIYRESWLEERWLGIRPLNSIEHFIIFQSGSVYGQHLFSLPPQRWPRGMEIHLALSAASKKFAALECGHSIIARFHGRLWQGSGSLETYEGPQCDERLIDLPEHLQTCVAQSRSRQHVDEHLWSR